jgi:hypothetical protein
MQDRERSRDLEETMNEAEEIHTQVFALQALPPKPWRTYHNSERLAFLNLKKSFEANDERISLSVVVRSSSNLIPGASAANTKDYVKVYVRGVRDIAEYVARVDRQRVLIVEQQLSQFLNTLTVEQQNVVRPIYNELCEVMTPGRVLRRIVVDTDQFEDKGTLLTA